jgi:FixJ family two-component response regulator
MIERHPCAVAVVDDDPEVLESFRFMLELAGFDVRTYSSAAGYLASSDPAPHCLILDHHMPVMTGLELTRALRAKGSAVPVVLITAAPSPSIVAKAYELGVVRVLEKPPSADELIRYVGNCC